MKIFKQYGSKEKLFEMMQKVNKIMLNEDDNSINYDQLVITAFDKLKSGELNNNISSNATTNDNESIIDIEAKDNINNIDYKFKFKVTYTPESDEQTVNIGETDLIGLTINNKNSNQQIIIDKSTLDGFNNKYSSELFDVVDKYFDAKTK